jgi:uroporphyrinogen-III decarboxylase
MPHYEEIGNYIHEKGKKSIVHFDANNKLLSPEIAKAPIDIVESFTPPPDCDLSLKEALAVWHNKIIWMNFQSSVHLASEEISAATTRQLLAEAGDGSRIIMGISENVPKERWGISYPAISRVLLNEGRLPLKKQELCEDP